MQAFCANCDKNVDVQELGDKCPTCHRNVLAGPSSPAVTKSRKGPILGVAAVAVLAAGGIAWWQCGCEKPATGAKAATAGQAVTAQSLAAKLAAAGLTGAAAVAPGTPDQAVRDAVKSVKDGAGLAAYVKSLLGEKKLREQDQRVRRADVPKSTAGLFADVVAGHATPTHAVEAAFLVAALAEASGQAGTLVTESAGVQSPLLLSRTRVGVKLADGTVIEPFAKAPMAKPTPVSTELATVWWLVLRSHAERMAQDFKAANADLAAADAVLPNQPVVAFARGVLQLDQGMTDQGLPTCEAALASVDDPLAKLALVQMAVQLDQPVKAWTLGEGVAKAHPELAEAHVAMGVLAMQRASTVPDAQKAELMTQAKTELEKALSIDPAVTGARAALAQWSFQQKDPVTGEKILREGAAAKDPDAVLLLAEWLRSQGKNKDALATLQEAGLDAHDERVVVAQLQNLMALKQTTEALQLVEDALKANPVSRQLMMLHAEVLRQEGRLSEAAEALKPLTASGPDAERAKLLQAQLFLQGGELQKALGILEPALAAKPDDKETIMLTMIAYALNNQGEKGDAVAKKAMDAKLMTVTDVAGVWLQARQPERAMTLLAAQMELPTPPPTEQIGLLAMLYTASGQKDLAVKLRDKMVKAAGDKGKDVATAVDQAIKSAEEELARMKKGEPAPEAAHP